MSEGQQTTQALAVRTYSADDAHELGLPSPDALNLLDNFAKRMQGSIFLPKALAGHPANILGVILMGRELAFQPMQSLRMFWVSPDGRIAMYADAMMAAMRSKGFKFPEKEFTKDRAYLKTVRPDGEDFEAEFTMEDAKTAGLANKDNYRHYPKQMLRARVIAETYRFLAADLGGSQIYAREEIEDVEYAEAGGVTLEGQPVIEAGPSPVGIKPEPVAPTPQPETPAPAPQPEPPAEPAAPLDFKERTAAIIKKIGGKDQKVATTLLAKYFRGFLALKKLPNETAIYNAPLDKLEAVLDQRMADLMGDPEGLGAELAGRPVQKQSPVEAEMAKLKWPEDVQASAKGLQKSLGHADTDFLYWLSTEPKLADMSHDDLRIFLPLFGMVKGQAWDLYDWSQANEKSFCQTAKGLESDAAEWNEATAKPAIAGLIGDAGLLGF